MKTLLLLAILFSTVAQAQTGAIKGTIKDSDTDEPLPFVNVIVYQTDRASDKDYVAGTATDMDGEFKIKQLEPGTYDVVVKSIEHGTEEVKGVIVQADKITFLDHSLRMRMEVLKPAIYLYSPLEIDVNIELNGMATSFTHPLYGEAWNVVVKGNKIFDVASQTSHDYLFWESTTTESSPFDFDHTQGFCVQGANCMGFFEEQLANLGLNNREMQDFITFWTPRLQSMPWIHIYFKVDDAYNDIMAIHVMPEPDVSRRIYMIAEPIDGPISVEEQTFSPLERNGFTLIEWGGTLMPADFKAP